MNSVIQRSSLIPIFMSLVSLITNKSSKNFHSDVFILFIFKKNLYLFYFFQVHLFVGSSWNTGPSVDYLFFRNNTPNELKLSTQLNKNSDQCAYCCQCSWTSTCVERTLVQGASGDPQWTCAGH